MQNKILYISYDGMTDPLGQSQVLPYIIGLTKLGYSFTLISCEKFDRFLKIKKDIDRICEENNIDWHPLIYHKSPPILSTLWDAYQIRRRANKLHQEKKFHLVHCRGYISALIGLRLKYKYSIKFLFDMRGLWADEKVDAGAWNLSHPIYNIVYKFFKQKEKEFFLNADQTISLTETGKNEIRSWDYMTDKSDNITVIPCCVDTVLFDYTKIEHLKIKKQREKLQISETDFILSYLGSIGTWYMLEEMLDFFAALRTKWLNAKFLFITHDEHERIKFEAERRGLKNNIIIQPSSRNELPKLLALSNLSVFFIKPTYSKKASSPTKQAEIMAMGIPLVCNAGVGDTDTLVKKYNAGYVLKSLNQNDYLALVQEINLESFSLNRLREAAIDYASLDVGIHRYSNVYKKCLDYGG